MPFFTIIIPAFQSSAAIKNAIRSVREQSFHDWEVLVLDGGSTDGTLEIAFSFTDPRIVVHSAPDQGPYDAMNKGIDLASGVWLLFLGSDDVLTDQSVLQDMYGFLRNSRTSIMYGDARIQGGVSWAKGEKVYGGKFTLYRLLRRNICHQAIFYKKSFLHQHQLRYNLTYPVSADWALNLRAWLIKPFQYCPRIISTFTAGGISSGGKDDGFQQSIPVLYKQYMNNPYTNSLIRFLYGWYRSLVN
jgi:glycosyltransferase involved in cell wall biosynthesis